MNALTAKKMVTFSLAATGAVVVVNRAASGEFPSPRIFIALGVIYVILGFAAEFAPQIAGPMALLVFLAVLFSDGGTALEGIARSIGKEQRKKRFRLIRGGGKSGRSRSA